MRMQDKKFKPESKPFKQNRICSMYRVTDENGEKYFAKFFIEEKLNELKVFQSSQYNQTVLNDLSDQIYPEHFLEIMHTYSIPQGFIFVTEPYEMNLQAYLNSRVIEEKEAMQIFVQVTEAIYSLYVAGFWHRNIRPEHFVKVGAMWKLESLVFNQQYQDSDGLECQYLWNPAYQPPQAYGRREFKQQELDEMIVWNIGSLLLDLLLSHHKLKDQSILNRFKGQEFTFKAIGVKKNFSPQVQDILKKMLHHNPAKRMKVDEYFSDQKISARVASHNKKGADSKKSRIYMSGQSSLSRSLSINSERSQQILTVKGFANDKKKLEDRMTLNLSKRNSDKLQNPDEFLGTIKRLTKDNIHLTNQFNTISQASMEESSMVPSTHMNQISALLMNPRVSKAVEAYKCYYDKCELLMIAINKLQTVNHGMNEVQAMLLNNYAVTFASLMEMHALAESMNQNLNFFDLEPELWSDFQSSNQFKGFKEIINFRRHQRKSLLTPIKERIFMMNKVERNLMNIEQIEDFVHAHYKSSTFQTIKGPYRKILKSSYDIITREFNKKKTVELASIGMYITYCMAIDKFYIPQDIAQNFAKYFEWMKIAPTKYVPLDEFQDYLDNADKKFLVKHSIYILRKYFIA